MTSHTTSKIFVIGGTGAQGLPVIGALVADKKYSVRALSRATPPMPAGRTRCWRSAMSRSSRGPSPMKQRCGKDSAAATGRTSTSMGSTPAKRPAICIGQSAATTLPSSRDQVLRVRKPGLRA